MKKKILIAEDDQAIVEGIRIILESEGYEVFAVDKSETIHEIIGSNAPHLILLDIWLFGEDGGKIAKTIKAELSLQQIPLILMSANNETEKITKEVGADDFLLKPFDVDELLRIVKKIHIRLKDG